MTSRGTSSTRSSTAGWPSTGPCASPTAGKLIGDVDRWTNRTRRDRRLAAVRRLTRWLVRAGRRSPAGRRRRAPDPRARVPAAGRPEGPRNDRCRPARPERRRVLSTATALPTACLATRVPSCSARSGSLDALVHAGRLDEAETLLDRLLGVANDVGLYAEMVDPSSGEQLGNMPQAFTHMAVVTSCSAISAARRGELPPPDVRLLVHRGQPRSSTVAGRERPAEPAARPPASDVVVPPELPVVVCSASASRRS